MKFFSSGRPVESLQMGCWTLLRSSACSHDHPRSMVKVSLLLRVRTREYHNKIHSNVVTVPFIGRNISANSSAFLSPFGCRTFGTKDEASQAVVVPLSADEAQLLHEATAEARRISALAMRLSPNQDSSSAVDKAHVSECISVVDTLMSLTDREKPCAGLITKSATTKEHVYALHVAFLSVIPWCISLAPQDASLVDRALELTCRADELGLSLHVPLYQQLMHALAEHTNNESIVSNIVKVSKMITSTLGIPLEVQFFSGTIGALIRRRKMKELYALLTQVIGNDVDKNMVHDKEFKEDPLARLEDLFGTALHKAFDRRILLNHAADNDLQKNLFLLKNKALDRLFIQLADTLGNDADKISLSLDALKKALARLLILLDDKSGNDADKKWVHVKEDIEDALARSEESLRPGELRNSPSFFPRTKDYQRSENDSGEGLFDLVYESDSDNLVSKSDSDLSKSDSDRKSAPKKISWETYPLLRLQSSPPDILDRFGEQDRKFKDLLHQLNLGPSLYDNESDSGNDLNGDDCDFSDGDDDDE